MSGSESRSINCPYCRARIPVRGGIFAGLLWQTVRLRAPELGTQIDCPACGETFTLRGEQHDPSHEDSAGSRDDG